MRIERTSLDAAKEMGQVATDFEEAVELLAMWVQIERGMVPHRVGPPSMGRREARARVGHWTEAFVERMGA